MARARRQTPWPISVAVIAGAFSAWCIFNNVRSVMNTPGWQSHFWELYFTNIDSTGRVNTLFNIYIWGPIIAIPIMIALIVFYFVVMKKRTPQPQQIAYSTVEPVPYQPQGPYPQGQPGQQVPPTYPDQPYPDPQYPQAYPDPQQPQGYPDQQHYPQAYPDQEGSPQQPGQRP